jgi:hypothetical protein
MTNIDNKAEKLKVVKHFSTLKQEKRVFEPATKDIRL